MEKRLASSLPVLDVRVSRYQQITHWAAGGFVILLLSLMPVALFLEGRPVVAAGAIVLQLLIAVFYSWQTFRSSRRLILFDGHIRVEDQRGKTIDCELDSLKIRALHHPGARKGLVTFELSHADGPRILLGYRFPRISEIYDILQESGCTIEHSSKRWEWILNTGW